MTNLDKPTAGSERNPVSDVDSYLAGVPEPARSTLEKVRQAIRAAVPEAQESISYQMPAFKYRGRFLVSYAAFKNHCSFFPDDRLHVEHFQR